MRKTSLFLVSVPLIWGCSAGPLGVDLSARVGASPTAAGAQLEQRLEAGNGITVDRVRVLVRKLKLEREGQHDDGALDDTTRDATPAGDDSELKLEAGPFLVDVSGAALNGGQVVKFTQLTVEPGFYDELKFKVAKISADEVGGNADLAELQKEQASVIIDGKIDGQSFRFVSGLEVEQERKIRFEVSGGAENVTLSLDPRAWFTTESGSRLDPRQSDARSPIEGNIKRSIDAFDDEDHDGGEDHDDDGDDDKP